MPPKKAKQMSVDGKKKNLPVSKVLSKKKEEREEEEEDEEEIFSQEFIGDEEENEEGSEYDPRGSDSEEAVSEDEDDAEETAAVAVRKKLAPKKDQKKPNLKKRRHPQVVEDGKGRPLDDTQKTKKAKVDQKEKKHDEVESAESEGDGKKGKKNHEMFNDKNLDCDLFNSAPTNVVGRRIRVASNLIITCRMISQNSNNLSYDYAAITFQRKTANDKMFEFVVPLNLVPRMIQAMEYIVAENPKFFSAMGEK